MLAGALLHECSVLKVLEPFEFHLKPSIEEGRRGWCYQERRQGNGGVKGGGGVWVVCNQGEIGGTVVVERGIAGSYGGTEGEGGVVGFAVDTVFRGVWCEGEVGEFPVGIWG